MPAFVKEDAMKRISLLVATTAIFALLIAFGCGGGSSSTAGGDGPVTPSIDEPAGGESPTDVSGDGSVSGDDSPGNPPTVVDARFLISGILRDSEGVPIPNAKITFHSDPYEVISDALGFFQALLDEGTHTVEIASESIGSYTGTIEVTASGFINDMNRAIGSFVAVIEQGLSDNACQTPRLIDLGYTDGANWGLGVIAGAFGHDVNAQGNNQTALIVGNSRMLANIDFDGRISGFYFPTVGSYNHVPYLSEVSDWVEPFQGAYGGIKRGDNYYWFRDRRYWNAPTITYPPITTSKAPIAEITYAGTGACLGTTVSQKAYIVYDNDGTSPNNLLILDFAVTGNACAPSITGAQFAFYSRFNPNNTNQMFKKWTASPNVRVCGADRLMMQPETIPILDGDSPYTIDLEAMNSAGTRLIMTDCTPGILLLEDAQRIVDDTICYPEGVIGSIAEWDLPSSRRIIVAIAGGTIDDASGSTALDDAERITPSTLEIRTGTSWSEWISGLSDGMTSAWRDRFERWLITMKMLADDETGAIIAAPSLEPTFYYSWPRDGTFQAVAYILAGKSDVAAKFFDFLFGPNVKLSNHSWVQAYSSLDDTVTHLGLPDLFNVNVEQDQPPTVLWGLWVYWGTNSNNLPSGVTKQQIIDVANYVLSQRCNNNGLITPSIDWHENPMKDIGQSLYTNAAAYAGLLAAAEMVEDVFSGDAVKFRDAAREIRESAENVLCSGGTCRARLKYDPRYIPLLANKTLACNMCSLAPFSNEPGEKIMTAIWPFHIFELGDPKAQSLYNSTLATHPNLTEFTRDNPLWIPRYLFSHLYAIEAVLNDEVTDTAFKRTLNENIGYVDSHFDDLTTDYKYLMDQYVGNEGGLKRGSASRPLGWSQAMGVLTALANKSVRVRVPMITEPDCTIGSGPCCDATGHFKPDTFVCTTQTELSCHNGTGCGSDVTQRMQDRYCSGASASCDGAYGAWSGYSVATDCATNQICSTATPLPSCVTDLITCGTCVHACSLGQTKCEGGRSYNCTTNASGCRVWDSGTACTTGLCAADGLRCDTCTHACSIGDVSCTSGQLHNCTTNASGCRVWDAGTACATGVCAADGRSCETCTHACSIGDVRCTGGSLQNCTTNASGCRVWGTGTACPSGACLDTTHCAACTSRDHLGCYSDDVYWYDSCGTRETTPAHDCGVDDPPGTARCSGSGSSATLVHDFVDRGCSGGTCFEHTTTDVIDDCDGAGCTSGACCRSIDHLQCDGGDPYWYSSCGIRQDKDDECGTDTPVGSNYCRSEDIYRDYDVPGCTTGRCTTTREQRFQTDCGTLGCNESTGSCCTNHHHKACSSGDVWWYTSCNDIQDRYQDCDATQTCSVDRCVCPSSSPWSPNVLTARASGSNMQLTWQPASSSWIHHYKVAAALGSDTPVPGQAISGNLTGTTFTHTGGIHGMRYTYIVYGYDSCDSVNHRNTSSVAQETFP